MVIESKLLGTKIHKDELLCLIVDPLGTNKVKICSPCDGLVIGKTNIPLVNEGDALFHLALFEDWDSLQLFAENQENWDEL